MFFMWEIYVNGERSGFVRAMTEDQARTVYYAQHGGASRYSGIGMGQIKAVKVNTVSC